MTTRLIASREPTLTREQYRSWVAQQPRGRFERVDGRVVAMSPERLAHALIKGLVWQALRTALMEVNANCMAFPDGATVEVGEHTDYEPDVTVTCAETLDLDGVVAPSPIIIVEVTSPSTQRADNSTKLADYFRLPSMHHYLIVSAHRREVIHHRRAGAGIDTRIVTSGSLSLAPPGVTVAIDDFYTGLPL